MSILKPNEIFANRYLLLKKLGAGGFSEVWLAEDSKSTKMQVALKIFVADSGLDSEGLKVFSNEYSLVFNLNHPNLLKPTHFEDWEDSPFLVMQYMPKGSCMNRCGNINELELAKFLLHIGGALCYLHQQNPPIIHQDIKPDNVLIDANNNYVLIDFGISAKIRKTLTKSVLSQKNSSGTTAYMAPERFSSDLALRQPIKSNDIFSLGVTLFELLTNQLPYGDLGGMIANNSSPAKLPSGFSIGLNQVIAKCLDKEAWNRPTAEDLKATADYFLKTSRWELRKGTQITECDVPQKNDFQKIETSRKTEKIPINNLNSSIEKDNSRRNHKKNVLIISVILFFLTMISIFVWSPWSIDHIKSNEEYSESESPQIENPNNNSPSEYMQKIDNKPLSQPVESSSNNKNEENFDLNDDLPTSLSKLTDPQKSYDERYVIKKGIIKQFSNKKAKVIIRFNENLVSYTDISSYTSSIMSNEKIKKFVVLECLKNRNGKIDQIEIKEED